MDLYSSPGSIILEELTPVLRLPGLVILHVWLLHRQESDIRSILNPGVIDVVILIPLLALFLPQDILITLYKMLGCILYVLMQKIRITSLEHYDNHDYGMFSFFYYYETFSFGTHVFTSILFSPLMLIMFGLKSVLVSVFLPFVWLFLGFPMNTIRYLLIITEYLFFIYGHFHFAILVITLILLCKAETLKIIQLVKTHGSYSVTIFIDFISSRVLSQLFLFWVAYFVIAMIKELDWGTFVSNFVTDMCRTIVGLASFGAAVIYMYRIFSV